MALAPQADVERRRFRVALTVWSVLVLAATTLLQPAVPPEVREHIGAGGLLIGGLAATGCGVWRARQGGPRARAWSLLALAGFLVVAGNLWVAVSGLNPVTSPSLISDVSVALGYLVSIPALLTFPGARRRGTELIMVLDGLVAGGALLLITSALVYPRLLDAPAQEPFLSQALAVVFPVLDVVVATVAVLLVVRASRTDRLMLGLVASGFLLYAASDLAYAARVADGTYRLGSLFDLGWVAGYLTLGLAACTPGADVSSKATPRGDAPVPAPLSDVPGTALLFSLVVLAALTQVVGGEEGSLVGAQSVVWVVLITAAATRQVLLVRANQSLRRNLEKQVLAQTAGLRQLVRQNEALVMSVADGVYGVDQEGRVTFANPSAVSMLGYPLNALVGFSAHDLFHAPDHDGRPFTWAGCYIHDAITRGELARGEEDDYLRADGTRIPVEITASPLVDEDVVRGAVVVFRDVTQRREIDRMKDEFLSVVSHELRTPLTSIRGSLGLLSGGHMGELPGSASPLVAVAQQSTERLARLVDDLLDLERVGAGAHPTVRTRLDVGELLRTCARQLHGLSVSADVAVQVEDSASGRIEADEDRLVQLVVNLVGNAVKFSPTGSVVVLGARREADEVHLSVRDQGRGIPEDKLESIFERFEQVDSSDSRHKGGAGLGLTISRAIVEQHGGRIWIVSEVGLGTVVHVALPAA